MTTVAVRWLYGDRAVDLALSRGWDAAAHTAALAMEDDDRVTIDGLTVGRDDALGLTHPLNHLTEKEVIEWERTRP